MPQLPGRGCDVGHRHCLPGRKSGELRRVGQSMCAAAFATNAAWCASRMRTSPRIHERPMSIASRGRVSRGCSCSKGCRTCLAQRAAHSASCRWCSPVNVPPRRMVISRGSRSAGRIGMSSFFLVIPRGRHVQSLTTHRRQRPGGRSGVNELDGRARILNDERLAHLRWGEFRVDR
jgi:hypothetical protein